MGLFSDVVVEFLDCYTEMINTMTDLHCIKIDYVKQTFHKSEKKQDKKRRPNALCRCM